MDFLSKWMQKLTDLNFLSPPFPTCKPCLFYADDTLVLLKPNRTQILKVKLVFDIFGYVSGLKINVNKSELVTNHAQLSFTQALADTILCKPATFPIRYLGLPLSDRSIKRIDYMPMIEKIRAVLATWKAPLLTIGGRIILTNAVLSAMPQYFMSVFLLPTWVVNKIDQIRKRFLWHGHKDPQNQHKSLYMVNWTIATKPRKLGGLGIRDLRAANQALLMKWMWQWHDPNHEWWREVSVMPNGALKPWNSSHSSPFWKSISTIQPAFDCSVRYQIGDGNNVQFWNDNWKNGPLKHRFPNLFAATVDTHVAVSQCTNASGWSIHTRALNSRAQAEQHALLMDLNGQTTTQAPDLITWTRNSSSFTVGSAYRFLTLSPSPTSHISNIWAIKAPLRVTVFTWLMLINRLATIDNLVKRGWQMPNMCALCNRDAENVQHLFRSCILSTQVRSYLYATFPHTLSIPLSFLTPHSFHMLLDPKENVHARQWEMVTSFVLWRERCRRIFAQKSQSHIDLVREIRAEYHAWFVDIHSSTSGHPY